MRVYFSVDMGQRPVGLHANIRGFAGRETAWAAGFVVID